jgi:hypothetical protein
MNSQEMLKKQLVEVARVEGTRNQFALRDLLTDLRHIANDMGLDFSDAIVGSEEVYHTENSPEG